MHPPYMFGSRLPSLPSSPHPLCSSSNIWLLTIPLTRRVPQDLCICCPLGLKRSSSRSTASHHSGLSFPCHLLSWLLTLHPHPTPHTTLLWLSLYSICLFTSLFSVFPYRLRSPLKSGPESALVTTVSWVLYEVHLAQSSQFWVRGGRSHWWEIEGGSNFKASFGSASQGNSLYG